MLSDSSRNRLVAELTFVRINDLAAPPENAPWQNHHMCFLARFWCAVAFVKRLAVYNI